jgi:hypothetical protein
MYAHWTYFNTHSSNGSYFHNPQKKPDHVAGLVLNCLNFKPGISN